MSLSLSGDEDDLAYIINLDYDTDDYDDISDLINFTPAVSNKAKRCTFTPP